VYSLDCYSYLQSKDEFRHETGLIFGEVYSIQRKAWMRMGKNGATDVWLYLLGRVLESLSYSGKSCILSLSWHRTWSFFHCNAFSWKIMPLRSRNPSCYRNERFSLVYGCRINTIVSRNGGLWYKYYLPYPRLKDFHLVAYNAVALSILTEFASTVQMIFHTPTDWKLEWVARSFS